MEAMERTHRENMNALATQREEHKDQHRENMEALKALRGEQSEQHNENMEALKELIRRTSATPDIPHPE